MSHLIGSSTVADHSNRLLTLPILLAAVLLAIFLGLATAIYGPYPWVFLAAGISFLIVCARWPSVYIALVVLYVLLLSLIEIQFSLAGMNIYAEDVLKLLSIPLIGVAIWQRRSVWPHSRLVMPLVVFLVLAGIEAVVGFFSRYSLRNILRDMSAVLGYAMIWIGYSVVREWRVLHRWVTVFLAIGFLTAVLALGMRVLGIEMPTGFEGSEVAYTAFGTVSRAYGLPGAVGFYIIGVCIGVALVIQSPRSGGQPRALMLWAVSGTCLLQILLMFGRSLFLGMLSGLALMALAWSSKYRLQLVIAGVAVAFLVLVVAPALEIPYAAEVTNRYLSIVDPEAGGLSAQATFQWRQDEARGVWEALGSWERIVGRGFGARLLVTVVGGVEVESFHNSIAEMLLKVGLVGLAIYAWFVIQAVREAVETMRQPGRPLVKAVYLALVAAFLGILVWGMGSIGMPFRANLAACLALGMGLRCRELLQSRPQDAC
jgi:hypothetical protein